ncbi:MAG: MATE family efflux transporter, partial [Elusimicrobiota bacterium]
VYTLADAIWVSGKGPSALTAVGFFFPFMMLAVALAVGLGVGGGAAISQRIGARNHKEASSVAIHTIVLMGILSIVYSIPAVIFVKQLFLLMGAGEALPLTVTYARIMFAGSVLIFSIHVASALLRSEGDAKRAMNAILIGTILNIFLDPVFIYRVAVTLPFGHTMNLGLDLGVAGAAYATVLSMGVSSLILFYWLVIQKKTYVAISFRKFRFRKNILYDILKVGIPAALSQMSMALMMFFITKLITMITGDTGVAVFTTGWRVVMIAVLPLVGIATAVTSVSGAAFGGREYDKLQTAFMYAVRIGFILELVLAVSTLIFAPYIANVFTWSRDTALLRDDIIVLLRTVWLFYPAVAFGMLSSAMFQGVGKGVNSLIITIARTLLLSVPLAALFGILFNMGMQGIYAGIVCGSWLASVSAFIWARSFIRGLLKQA